MRNPNLASAPPRPPLNRQSLLFYLCLQMSQQWLTHVRWVIATYFSFDALVQNQLSGGTVDCSQGFDPTMVQMLKEGLVRATPLQKAFLNQLASPQPGCVCAACSVTHNLHGLEHFLVWCTVRLACCGADVGHGVWTAHSMVTRIRHEPRLAVPVGFAPALHEHVPPTTRGSRAC
jgi:hypothetical protein